MAPATIERATVERGAAVRAALGWTPELKTPSRKRLTRSKVAKSSKAKGKGSSKPAPVGDGTVKESAGGAPSRPARRSRAASVKAESVNERSSTAKAPPRVTTLDKGKRKRRQVEPLEAVEEEERSPVDSVHTQAKTTTKSKGKLVEIPDEDDPSSDEDEDEERAAESDATEIVDESELTGKVSNTEARQRESVQPTDAEGEDLDPNQIIPRMNTLVQEDIADLKMINQLEDILDQVTKDTKSILHGCQRERLFRDRLETYLRYCTFNNHPDSKFGESKCGAGGGVLIPWGPNDNRLADEYEEEEYWQRTDEEIQKDLDYWMPESEEE
ncbi:hypothetical protein EDD18DRAFT_1361358 [Armillaria luteobubalina]|uniref:Uncharacterized protein n=1 Tax=Armillaria luteobubalina TaxID=153913 RepID=A0AA39UEW6_9AGAR|nr:hypothetical protein EDD18DRAFT_1361358 [Armillaria luteobubalina]